MFHAIMFCSTTFNDLILQGSYNTIQYKFIYMAAISWIKRKTITHEQRHAFKITLLGVGQRKRYKSSENELSVYEQTDMASQIATVQN